MTICSTSEYNRDQLASFRAIQTVCASLGPSELAHLREKVRPYLDFRTVVEEFQTRYFQSICTESCFETGLSACCGFESIITFFADQVITFLLSEAEEIKAIFEVLERPNNTGKCVYLGRDGCLWRVRCIACATFFCDTAKRAVFEEHPEAEPVWREILEREKEFTRPTQLVLFDELEQYFLQRGAESPLMYFHRSPGLLRLKAEAGLIDNPGLRKRNKRRRP